MAKGRSLALLGAALGLTALCAQPARANVLTDAHGTADCNGYTVTVDGVDLDQNTDYTVDFDFNIGAFPGVPFVASSYDFLTGPPPSANATCSLDTSGQYPAGALDCTASGSGSWPGSPLSGTVTITGIEATIGTNGPPIILNGIGQSVTLICTNGCPATFGYWKKHKWPASVVQNGLTIGGVNYTQAQLLSVLKSASTGNAVTILGHQLIAALVNQAAQSKDNTAADAAIADAQALLAINNINLLTSVVPASSALGAKLLADSSILDGYNSADFNTCSEGSGLVLN